MDKIKAVIYGVGTMNSIIARYLLDADVEIVGAISRSPGKVGKDLGEVAGLGRELGVTISDNPHLVFEQAKPDIAVIAVTSYLVYAAEQLRIALEHGVNVVTLSEESLYPWGTAPEVAAELDALAKQKGVTVTGTGFQDTFWVNAVALLMGSAHRIDSVSGLASWSVDDFGPELAEGQQVGKTPSEFSEWLASAERPPTFGRMVLDALVADTRLTPVSITTTTEPEIATEPTRCEALDIIVEPGRCIGFTDTDEIKTAEGPVFAFKMSGKLYRPGEGDVNEWAIKGEPDLVMSNGTVPTRIATCAQIVNRIPDVISAPPGFVTIEKLPRLRYRAFPLAAYL
jgi:4-hydroxy-tetrahydrodipicolinate reductase